MPQLAEAKSITVLSISTLHQIQEDDRLLDSLAVKASRIPDNNTTLPWPGPATASEPEPPTDGPFLDENLWPRLGAKPKAQICSTPAPSQPWTV
ncbi:hypothetical protein GJAV_G00016850 [Gymnothorax javanicus]|nr:hypothetical protein GJAV_G00016850 [Gymnothorax javanicus]